MIEQKNNTNPIGLLTLTDIGSSKKETSKKRKRQKQMSLTFQQSGHHWGSDSACYSGKQEFVMIKSVGFKTNDWVRSPQIAKITANYHSGNVTHFSGYIMDTTKHIQKGTSWHGQRLFQGTHSSTFLYFLLNYNVLQLSNWHWVSIRSAFLFLQFRASVDFEVWLDRAHLLAMTSFIPPRVCSYLKMSLNNAIRFSSA